jgi:hypothetical protein
MPQNELNRQIALFILFMSFCGALANVLSSVSEKGFLEERKLYLIIQTLIGSIGGMIFGCFACWLIGENIWAIGAISGAGAVLGIKGVKNISLYLEKYLKNKLNV